MNKLTMVLGLLAAFTISQSCDLPSSPGAGGERVAWFSFEPDEDNEKWAGYGDELRREDTPPVGRKYSLFVSGGCTIPHLSLELPVNATGAYYSISAWGKVVYAGGGIKLHRKSQNLMDGEAIAVKDSTWTHYNAEEKVYCSEGDTLVISMYSGGFVAGGMLVDKIEIYQIDTGMNPLED
ncbi:MAG: hypothetical protein K9N46_13230 [Candidatus Marinimicrobia bacterium]|nr:hypothetical protein [Candidatus Neomarinimicrobiota bacterium]MCF7829745.1 hypothetical protein [Candidatus Neomarinimicrobiota bacterium]MCF7881695.1 hypothetical protein [Candidatus Neomarinimicrobiota bacterium]